MLFLTLRLSYLIYLTYIATARQDNTIPASFVKYFILLQLKNYTFKIKTNNPCKYT